MKNLVGVSSIGLGVVCACVSMARAQPTNDIRAEAWIQDIRFMTEQIQFYHPDPYAFVSRERFHADVERLVEDVPKLSDQEIVVGMMRIVDHLDGHSRVHPFGISGFDRWFPVRFHHFADGLAVMTIDKEHEALVGATVLRVGSLSVGEALEAVMPLWPAENRLGKLERAPALLSSPAVMHALDVVDDPNLLSLEVRLRDGQTVTVELEAYTSRYDRMDFRIHGEAFPPPWRRGRPLATPFPGKTGADLLSGDPRLNDDLPLYQRSRKAYWYQPIDGESAMYMQINSARAQSAHSDQSFRETYLAMFDEIDTGGFETLILDVRWHGGGDGSVNRALINEIVKREGGVNAPGQLFVLMGKKTYSAACMLVQDLRHFTHATFVGEPAGQYASMFGDPVTFTLPRSGMEIWVATLWWQYARSDDARTEFPIQIPVELTIDDYFSGRDPLLDAALSARGRPRIYQIVEEQGVAAALAAYEKRRAAFGHLRWWSELHEGRINRLGYRLLRSDSPEDHARAVEVFRMNTESHAKSWNTWDSYGEALLKVGRRRDAAQAYARALELEPRNAYAPVQRRIVEELEGDEE